jgi:UPF0716 family protein affecting phage T7 exclusion
VLLFISSILLISGGLVTDILGLVPAGLLAAWRLWRREVPLRQTREV